MPGATRKCCVKGCSSNNKNRNLSFFSIPKVRKNIWNPVLLDLSVRRRTAWLNVLQLPDFEYKISPFVCSLHFTTGFPSDIYENTDVDWIPTLKLAGDELLPKPDANVERVSNEDVPGFIGCDTPVSLVCEPLIIPGTFDPSIIKVEETCTENEDLKEEIRKLKQSIRSARRELAELESQNRGDYNISKRMVDDDQVCFFYTGIESFGKLMAIFNFFDTSMPAVHQQQSLSRYEQFVLTLITLKSSLRLQDLAHHFQVSLPTVSNYFHQWITAMQQALVPTFLVWPEKSAGKCVSIIQCFEMVLHRSVIFTAERGPNNNQARGKSHRTVKFLVSITPRGAVSMVSKSYSGLCTDQYIVLNSKFLDSVQIGDLVLTERGFLISEKLPVKKELKFNIAAYRWKSSQLVPLEVEPSGEMAEMRASVERVIKVLRQRCSTLIVSLQREMCCSDEEDFCSLIDNVVAVTCFVQFVIPPSSFIVNLCRVSLQIKHRL